MNGMLLKAKMTVNNNIFTSVDLKQIFFETTRNVQHEYIMTQFWINQGNTGETW